MAHDLVLRGGRVIDPVTGWDEVADVAFSGGRLVGIGKNLKGLEVVPVEGSIVSPGLIDLHTHVYWGGTSLGVDPEEYAAGSALTTVVDAGSAGPGNYAGFRAHVIAPAKVRILAYLHVSFAGIYAFSDRIMVGESHDMRLLAAREAAAVAAANRDTVVGIKVRIGRHASGASGIMPLDVALDVGDRTGLPVMVHIDEPPPSYEEVVARLRPGDVLTHCFRPFPNAPVHGDGRVREAVLAARERGVLFDVGHGMGSFSWRTAREMLAAGFAPDVISSDVHSLCIEGPACNQLRTMTKFLSLGMSMEGVVRASTLAAADAMQRADLGRLVVGETAEASVIRLAPEPVDLEDVEGNVLPWPERLVPVGRVMGGRWVPA